MRFTHLVDADRIDRMEGSIDTRKNRVLWPFCASMAYRIRSWFVLGGLLVWPCTVYADPSAAQRETARSLMAQARELRDRGDNKGALVRFKAADAIMGVPTTAFEVARTQTDLALLVEARETLRRLRALPQKPDEPEPFREARTKAEALDAELAPRIGALHFVVTGAERASLDISVDGEPVPRAVADVPFRVDPGHHRVLAKSGGQEISREVDAGERETRDVELAFTSEAPSPANEAPSEPQTEPRRQPDHRAPTSSGGTPTLAYVAGGIGLAGVALGGVTGLLALSKRNSAETGCNNGRCPPPTWKDLDAAHTYATVSTIGFIVGAVGVAVGAGCLIFASDDSKKSSALLVSPVFSERGGAMLVHGRF